MPEVGNFRTTQIANVTVLVYNTGKGVRAYRNYGVLQPSGTLAAPIVTTEPKLHCEVKHGGMVWTTLDPNPTQSVEEWTCGAFDCIADAIDAEDQTMLLDFVDTFADDTIEQLVDFGKHMYLKVKRTCCK